MNKRMYMKAMAKSCKNARGICVGQSSCRHNCRTKLLSILGMEMSVRGAKLRGQTIVDY